MIKTSPHLADILESIGQAAIIFCDNHITCANEAFVSMMGYSLDTLYQYRLLNLIYPASRDAALGYFRQVLSTPNHNQSISIRLNLSNERLGWGNVIVKSAPYAGEGCYLALVRDITDEILSPKINYPAIIENLPIGIYRTTLAGKFIYANQTFVDMLGFKTFEQLKQHNVKEFYTNPQQREEIIQHWEDSQAQTFFNEVLWRDANNEYKWIRSMGQLLRDDDGRILYLQGSAQDYTERKEQKTRLKQRHQELEVLQKISTELGKSLDLQQTLHTILEELKQIIPFVSASIYLIQDGSIEMLAHQGIPEMSQPIVTAKSQDFLAIKHFKIFEEQETILIPDVLQEADWLPVKGMEYIRSWMGVGLRYQGEVIGLLNLDHDEADFYTHEHMHYAKAVAGQAAIAIANARYYQQAQDEIKRRREAQDILIHNLINTETVYWVLRHLFTEPNLGDALQAILNMLSAAFEQSELILIVFEPESGELRYSLNTSGANINRWKIFKTIANAPHLLKDAMPDQDFEWLDGYNYEFADGRKAFAAAVWQRGMLAAIRHDATQPDFTEANIELLVTIANQLTIALKNEEYTKRLRKQSKHFRQLADRRSQQLSVELQSQRALLDATAEGIFYMENFRMQYANPAFCRMVGYSLAELYGKPFSFIHVNSEVANITALNDLLDDRLLLEAGRSETRLRHKDGTDFYASVRFSMIGEPGNDVMRMVAVARDITQERELYFERARFIANAAHELRNPLSRLILRTHLIKRQPENAVNHLAKLDSAVEILKQIVEELLDLSRFERGTIMLEREMLELQSIMREVIEANEIFAQEQNVTLHLKMPEQPIAMNGDLERMKQMFNNLLINSINYTEAGDHIEISLYHEEDEVGNQSIIIEFVDDGIGIDADLLPSKIFEPFVRPSEGERRESGMGLALSREIVQLHGGTIHARNNADGGSTYRIVLPLDLP